MRFKPALWDNSDLLYAPCMRQAQRWFYWRAPARYVAGGYSKAPVRLPGEEGDDLALTRAAKCRDLTMDMLQHFDANQVQVTPGTWLWLIGRYKKDEFSPFAEVKENSRDDYLHRLSQLEPLVGQTSLAETDLATLKRWQKAMREGHEARAETYNAQMRAKGLHERPVDGTDHVKRLFTMMRILVGFGVQIKNRDAREIRDILSEMRIKSPKPRTASPTETQIAAVVDQADLAGDSAFALGVLCQWWLTLRAVDVRGQWLGKPRRWADGLTWDMIDRDMTTLSKTPSKTERSAPEVLIFDLTQIPELRTRLMAIPLDQRVGPVIKQPNGVPFQQDRWSKLYRRYADRAGLPREILMMDTRAGAINHAKRHGATATQMQHQANHAQSSTTDRYVRERSASINSVIQMRRDQAIRITTTRAV